MAKPKIALVPSAQGSKFYSVLPSSGVGDFDFTRSGSATRINSQGLIETVGNGVSRLNYPMIDGKVVGCPSHLLEPARTNLALRSDAFDNSVWLKLNTTISTNTTISPDGSLNADSLFETTTNLYHDCLQNCQVSSGVTYTFSCFVKPNGRDNCYLYTNDGGGKAIKFNVSNGTIIGAVIGTDDGSKITYFGNGWYRVEMKLTATETATKQFAVSISDNNSETISAYVGDVTKGIIIWGAMLEQGSYSTSYIPTNGSAVTRSAETANNAGDASTFNDSEGVLMVEISALANDGTNRVLGISDNSASDRVIIYFSSTSNQIALFISSLGISQTLLTYNLTDVTTLNKVAAKYKLNDIGFWVNGFEVGIDTLASMPVGLLDLSFDNGTGTEPFYGSTKQIQYFDSALTDSELEQLTSWTSFTDMANGQQYSII